LVQIDISATSNTTSSTGVISEADFSGSGLFDSGEPEESSTSVTDNSPTVYTSTFTDVFPGTKYLVSIVAVRNITDELTRTSNETTARAETSRFFNTYKLQKHARAFKVFTCKRCKPLGARINPMSSFSRNILYNKIVKLENK